MSFEMQVVDVKGPSVLQMIKHMRSVENQAEFSHNSDYVPESLGKVCSLQKSDHRKCPGPSSSFTATNPSIQLLECACHVLERPIGEDALAPAGSGPECSIWSRTRMDACKGRRCVALRATVRLS